ncbi:preprotein translocase subunit SecE [Selenomonadales bacterium OttesenSCG-928-I06]|nr:preprotein translocase subunit SecE [Selenomonadales bacterium OttesenSCG-928-I06]
MAAQQVTMKNSTGRLKRYIREVKAELKKVIWPTKPELISYAGIVFVTVLFVAILIWLLDAGFTKLLKFIW